MIMYKSCNDDGGTVMPRSEPKRWWAELQTAAVRTPVCRVRVGLSLSVELGLGLL